MTARASTSSEGDVSTRVDSKAIVLVLDIGSGDIHASGRSNVEGIGVVAKSVSRRVESVTSRVVDGDILDVEVRSTVDGEALHWVVLNVQAGDGGVDELVSVEELWLGDTAVGTFAIPPGRAVTVDNVA